jgi:dihydrofolate reductase
MNGMPKYVVSATLEKADWQNSTILPGDPVAEVTALKARLAGNILVAGSTTLVHTLHDAGLVDEYRLMIYPTVLGSGKRLFRDGAGAAGYEAVDVRPAGAVALMTLRPLAEGGAAAA